MKRAIGLLLGTVFVMCMGSACEDLKEACGPCGTIESGDGTISGDAKLDGFFKTLGSLNANIGGIDAGFEAQVKDLAAAFEVEGAADMELDALIEATIEEIEAELDASIVGGIDAGLKIDFVPPKCEVNVKASVSAQAQCEAKADCDVDVNCEGGEMSFECEGTCEGKCEGTCDVPVCNLEMSASLECTGDCSGQCTTSVSADCEGDCHGTCSGDCAAFESDGTTCKGACSGNCQGECSVVVEGDCGGKCEGECKAEFENESECSGEIECKGTCQGSCSGGCQGEIKAPKCSANAECEASGECNAQAEASASANAGCSPPSLELKYSLTADLEADAVAKAKFLGKMQAFKKNMIGMLQGMANLKILFDAEAAAEIGIEPPVVTLAGSFDDLLDAGLSGNFNVKPALAGCTISALEEAVDILGSMPGKISGTVEGQVKFYAILFD